ncbi:MAG: GH3 auxin-responsive promoter family protein [Candidatus Omnitrophica bacterium]|nr:GH3 auxin-responsive promoter family protein [Candidatus Omnitrophota bacterium]
MVKKIKIKSLNTLLKFSCRLSHEKFITATHHIAETQKGILLDILNKNTYTELGFEHNFKDIDTIKQFKTDVPLRIFKDYIPYLKSIVNGKETVLTHESVDAFIVSKGSSHKSKYIPRTNGLATDIRNAINPWVHSLYLHEKEFLKGTFYWALNPKTEIEKSEKIPIGYDNDDQFLNPFQHQLLRMLHPVPHEVVLIEDIENFRYVTLLFLLCDSDLSLISIKHPKSLTFLMESIEPLRDAIVADMKTGTITTVTPMKISVKKRLLKKWKRNSMRAAKLNELFNKWFDPTTASDENTSLYEKIWPKLKLISCWADGDAAIYIPKLNQYFPNVMIQPKGLQTIEGIVSFPINKKNESVLAVCSHFYEFLDINNKESKSTRLAHQLEKGKAYSVIITTHGGLYRYQLNDIIEVTGFMNQCPIINFIAKNNRLVDLFGEKLYEGHVAEIFDSVVHKYRINPSFMMLAPAQDPETRLYFYTCYIALDKPESLTSTRWQDIQADMEGKLSTNSHYRFCIEAGQLRPLRIFLIQDSIPAKDLYIQFIKQKNKQQDEVQLTALNNNTNLMQIFKGNLVG